MPKTRQENKNKTTEQKQDTRKTWTDISGLMRVWGNEVPGNRKRPAYLAYSTSVGRKNEDDKYDNLYYRVIFRKGEEPDLEGAFDIEIINGFLTLSVTDKQNYPAIMVMDYELLNQ